MKIINFLFLEFIDQQFFSVDSTFSNPEDCKTLNLQQNSEPIKPEPNKSKLEKLQDIYRSRNTNQESKITSLSNFDEELKKNKSDKTLNLPPASRSPKPGEVLNRTKTKKKSSPALEYIRSLRNTDTPDAVDDKGKKVIKKII